MLAVLLVIHLIACVALVVTVMLQRSEGGALGMGGGGAGGGLMSGRGVAGVLVRTTMGLAAAFFITSLALTRLNTEESRRPSALEQDIKAGETDVFSSTPTAPAEEAAPAESPAQEAPQPADPFAPVLETPGAGEAPAQDIQAPTE